jgi:hypothetical protein
MKTFIVLLVFGVVFTFPIDYSIVNRQKNVTNRTEDDVTVPVNVRKTGNTSSTWEIQKQELANGEKNSVFS